MKTKIHFFLTIKILSKLTSVAAWLQTARSQFICFW